MRGIVTFPHQALGRHSWCAPGNYASSSLTDDAIATLIVGPKHPRTFDVMGNTEYTLHVDSVTFASHPHILLAMAVNAMELVACSNDTARRCAFAMNTMSGVTLAPKPRDRHWQCSRP